MNISRIDSVSSSTGSTAPVAPTAPMPVPPTESAMATQTMPSGDAIPGEHIVVFRPDVSRAQQTRVLAGLAPRRVEALPLVNGVLLSTDPGKVPAFGSLSPDLRSAILFTQPNYVQHLRGGGEGTPEAVDPEQVRQYHLDNTGQGGGTPGADVKAGAAWTRSRGEGVVVAIADTNIDITHPDIAPNVWTNPAEVEGNGIDDDANGYVDDVHGWNFGTNTNRPQDGRDSHGTHVAGIIGAAQGNGIGGAGVAPDVQLMPLAILTSNATTANAIKAFGYAVQNGADVISNSWGGNRFEPAMAEAVRQTVARGVSVVVAAGNENWDTGVNGSYPDNYAGAFSVAASDARDGKASYSNRGTITIDVAAPGDKIISTLPGSKYGALSGTSMAAPVVSGILALVKARYPHLSMREVEERVSRSVQRDGSAKVWNSLVASGGRVDADAALAAIATPAAPTVAGARAGSPATATWASDLAEGQAFDVEFSANASAKTNVAESFDGGVAQRAFATSGDLKWGVSNAVAKSGTHSFNVNGLGSAQQSRLDLTETITEPTELSFAYSGARGGELSFFINRDLQFQPATGDGWKEFRTVLQPGTYTFTWLAAGKGRQTTPVAIDDLRIGNVSDATWTKVGRADAATSLDFTPDAATGDAAVRVRADNGRMQGDWVQGAPFVVEA